jgi:hypothetical protein
VAKSLQLKIAFWAYLLVFWCAAAYAAETDLAKGLESIPFAAIKYVLIFSFIGGAAGTLNKIANPDIAVKRVWLEMLKDLASSLVAGLIIFFFASWTSISFWLQAAFITLGGFGGSRVVDRMVDGGLFTWIDRISGKVNKDTTP